MKVVRKLSIVLIFVMVLTGTSVMAAGRSCVSLTYTLDYGKTDATTAGQVSVLQNFLYGRGDLSVPATGYFGPLTLAGVKEFQADSASGAVDGIVGIQTRAHILAASCGLSNPIAPVTSPTISSITPSQGAVGTTVTLYGSNFAADDTVHFAAGDIGNFTVNNDGTVLTFTIPSTVGPHCATDQPCPMYVMLVTNGTYQISVEGNGQSNTVPFTVTGGRTLGV